METSINDINSLYDYMIKNIEYGYIDKDNKRYYNFDGDADQKYYLQDPSDMLKTKIGCCWDQVEFERYYLNKFSIEFKTFFIVYYNNINDPSHSFLAYEKDNKWYWLECSWKQYRGIHEYISLDDLTKDVRIKFINSLEEKNNIKYNNLCLYEYSKPRSNISTHEFYKHCGADKPIVMNL